MKKKSFFKPEWTWKDRLDFITGYLPIITVVALATWIGGAFFALFLPKSWFLHGLFSFLSGLGRIVMVIAAIALIVSWIAGFFIPDREQSTPANRERRRRRVEGYLRTNGEINRQYDNDLERIRAAGGSPLKDPDDR